MRLNKESIKNLSKQDQIAVRKALKDEKKELKKEVKGLVHDVCLLRDGGKCLRCGSTEGLCASHIYPKGKYKKMEFVLENVKTLCFACHIPWWHKNPIEAKEWLEENIDPERLGRLKLMTQYINKKPIDFKMIKIYLEQEIERMKKENDN